MNEYNENSIQALTDREHVRLRPAMYIASTNQQGINQLIYEIVDNCVDEFLSGYGKIIDIQIYKDCSVRIRDYGRGIPVGIVKDKNNNDINSLTLVCGSLNSGGKYTNDIYQYSAGLHGIGMAAVNFCSDFFIVTVYRDNKKYQQKFEQGIPVTDVQIIDSLVDVTGTEIYYKPDKTIFKQTLKPSNDIRQRVQELAALNSGLTINYSNELNNTKETFLYDNGIINYLQQLVSGKKLLFNDPIHINNNNIEIAFLINKELESLSFIKSFCNNINNYEGGYLVANYRIIYWYN